MNQLLFTLMRFDTGDDIRERWHRDLLKDSLFDVKAFAVIITIILCVLALAVVMLVVAKILEMKNDYGDEDEMHMRKSRASSTSGAAVFAFGFRVFASAGITREGGS